jgi:hypothetical protein
MFSEPGAATPNNIRNKIGSPTNIYFDKQQTTSTTMGCTERQQAPQHLNICFGLACMV